MAAVNKTISKDQEEEMSSALIAQLLAEDNMSHGNENYYAEYSNDARGYDPYHVRQDRDDSYEENSEDDFDPKKKKYISKKDVAKRGRKRKAPVATIPIKIPKEPKTKPVKKPAVEPTMTETTDTTIEKAPVNKKPKKPLGEGYNAGVYNELEEKNFLEGLELFGRDWGKLQRHVATRDSNSIRSHAQKHFIKMFRDKVPLPDKIRESGEGYTLSGKPLDPNSAAAKPYLRNGSGPTTTKKKDVKKLDDPMQDVQVSTDAPSNDITPMEVDKAPLDKEKVSLDKEKVSIQVDQSPVQGQDTPVEAQETPTQEQETPVQEQETPAQTQETPAQVQETSMEVDTKIVENQTKELVIGDDYKKTRISESSVNSATPSPSNSSTTSDHYDAKGRTNYSTSRLRRQREHSANYGQINRNDDPLTMIKCEPFVGKPGSNVNGCQPFEITVESNVLLAMDFHAHLMTTEIIGFLAGKWDKETMRMSIREAFPCRSIETGQNEVNVEMDPTSAIETRQLIEERHLQVVGWYHSHPTFIPDPSLVDIENQRNYQVLCRDGHDENLPHLSSEPFVGAIVGPYDPALPGSASVINWFHVSNTNTDSPVPKKLIYELNENDTMDQVEIDRLFDLLTTYKDSREKVVFGEHWRQDGTETKLQKMIKSLASRMPWIQKQLKSENQSPLDDMFLNKIQSSLKDW